MRSLLSLMLVAVPISVHAQTPHPISLSEAIARGRTAGVQSTLARLAVEQSTSRADARQADRRPGVLGSASALRQTVNIDEFGLPFGNGVTDPFSVFRARVGASQVIFNKALFDRVRLTRDSINAVTLDGKRAGELSAAVAGAAWLRLARAIETVRARENDSVTALALRDIASAQVDAGTAARIERTRSENQLANVRGQLSLARIAQSRAQLDLARALDFDATEMVVPSGEYVVMVGPLPTDGEAAVKLALVNRPDLQAERERTILAEGALRALNAEALPTVVAQGFAQTSGVDLAKMSTSWNVGVGLEWSIFDGQRRHRRETEQQLRIDAQHARVHELEQQITSDARLAVLDLTAADEQLALAELRVRLATAELDEARERLAAGVTGTTETTRAQGEVSAARDNLIQARVSVGAAQLSAAATFGLLERIN